MPSNLMFADSSFPKIEVGENPQQSIRKIQNYLFMLLEQLRYTLQNLSLEENFNDSELGKYFKKLLADMIVADVIISNTIITEELYAQYGSIADLTVDKLRTDYKRARRHLEADTSPLNYIYIHDEEIAFLTSVTDGTQSIQMEVDGQKFWWRDATKTQMTREKDTGIPVMVYVYQELTKADFKFRPIVLPDGTETVMPMLTFGAGTGVGKNGQAVLRKNPFSMDLEYVTTTGKIAGVYLRDDGFADVTHRRADVTIDTAGKTITVKPEGLLAAPFDIAYTESGDTLSLTWPDGKLFRVTKT